MEHFVRSLKVFWRSERMLSQNEFRLMAQKVQCNALAGLVALFGLVMLSLSIFFALVPSFGEALAALTIAGIDLLLAGVLVAYARTLKTSSEIAMVVEVRDLALADMESEVTRAEAEVSALKKEVQKFVRNPFESLLPMAIGPLVGVVAQGLRSQEKSKKEDESPPE